MDNKRSSNFRISIDEKRPDAPSKPKNDDAKIRRLGRQTTAMFLLLVCLVGVVFFIGYVDIKKRLSKIEGSGTMEVKGLSKTLDARVTRLAEKINEHEKEIVGLGDSLSKKILPIEEILLTFENNNAAINKSIKKVENDIEQLESAMRSDKKALQGSIEAVNKRLDPVKSGLQKADAELSALEDRLNRELIELVESISAVKKEVKTPSEEIETIRTEIKDMKSEIADISSGDIYKQVIDITLKKQQKYYEGKLDAVTAELESVKKTLNSVLSRMKSVEKDIDASHVSPAVTVPTKKPAVEKRENDTTVTGNEIIEKDIE